MKLNLYKDDAIMKKWTEEEENLLEELYIEKIPTEQIAKMLNRPINSINHKVSRLGFVEKYGVDAYDEKRNKY